MEPIPAILALVIVVAAALLWPRHGLLARVRTARANTRRMLLEDFLKHVHAREIQGNLATTESLAGSFQLRRSDVLETLAGMERSGLISYLGSGLRLTPDGNQLALRVVRAHRLLERYLYDELRMPLGSLHAEADRREHAVSAQEIDELDARLGYPAVDPHGDPIPTSAGDLATPRTVSLVEWPDGIAAEIIHLEDEPPELFDRILRSGLSPGMHVEVLERADGQLILYDGTRQYTLSELAATNVFVRRLPHPVEPPLRLSELKRGETARICTLEAHGLARRRLQDLGMTPGTLITRAFDAPLGEPVAFRVRDAVVALRKDDADGVLIERVDPSESIQPQ